MIGLGYYTSGLMLRPHGFRDDEGFCWGLHLDFFDSGFVNDDHASGVVSTEGQLRARYVTAHVTAAARVLLADAARLGIRLHDTQIFVEGDGENGDVPDDWRWTVRCIAAELGAPWVSAYDTEVLP